MALLLDNQVDPASLTDAELAAALLDADRERSAATARELVLLGEFDARQVHAVDGALTAASWLAHRGDVSSQAAGQLCRDARVLRRHPASLAACATVGTGRVSAFVRRLNPRIDAAYRDAEADLLGHMATLTVDEVTKLATAWARMVDEDGPEPADDSVSWLRMARSGDCVSGSYALHGEHAAAFEAIVRREADRIYRSEPAGGKQANEHRNAQALMDLLRVADGADPARSDPSRASVIVNVPIEHFGGDRTQRVCTIDPFDTPISAETARRLMCDAKVHRFITSPDSVVLDLGYSARTVEGHQRLAVITRDRHCTFPGCARQPSMCHTHHIVHWETGGPTDMHNLTLLCHRHHHLVHEGHFGCQRLPDGHLQFTRPNGTPIDHPTRAGP